MELFCATCGTRLQPPAETCPVCGRRIDWDTGSQPFSFVGQETPPCEEEQQPAEEAAGSQPCEEYELPVTEETRINLAEEDARCSLEMQYLSAAEGPAPLEFGETVTMCIYAMVPLAGLILLTLVMLFSDEEEQNRKTLAKALLVAHLGLMLLLVIGWALLRPIMLSYMMSGYSMIG